MLAVVAGYTEHMVARESSLWRRFTANLEAAEKAMEAARAEPFVTGSTGQPVEHPGFKTAARCDELALKLYRVLTEGQVEALAGITANGAGNGAAPHLRPMRSRR